MSSFESLGLIQPILRAISSEGYDEPTSVQREAIPALLAGRDVVGVAQTGTGKTAAFALPVLQSLSLSQSSQGSRVRRAPRALILSPTRELATQIGGRFQAYGACLDLSHVVVFGGVSQNAQVKALRRGVDILVATPGRLLDLAGQGVANLSAIEFLVLDEADRMLDMGFIRDLRRILRMLPKRRQNLLFSATIPSSIESLAKSYSTEPVRIEVTPDEIAVEAIDQRVMFVRTADKRHLLIDVIEDEQVRRAIVFTRTKHGANRLVKQLQSADIDAVAIHGNKTQSARTRALTAFRRGEMSTLVATDIASRGIDVEGVTHVFNYDLPNEPEVYVHRIGRTARAGSSGVAVAFCDGGERQHLRRIERLIGGQLRVDDNHRHLPHLKASPQEDVRESTGSRKRPVDGGRTNGRDSESGGGRRDPRSKGRHSRRGEQSGRGGRSRQSRNNSSVRGGRRGSSGRRQRPSNKSRGASSGAGRPMNARDRRRHRREKARSQQ